MPISNIILPDSLGLPDVVRPSAAWGKRGTALPVARIRWWAMGTIPQREKSGAMAGHRHERCERDLQIRQVAKRSHRQCQLLSRCCVSGVYSDQLLSASVTRYLLFFLFTNICRKQKKNQTGNFFNDLVFYTQTCKIDFFLFIRSICFWWKFILAFSDCKMLIFLFFKCPC